MRLLPLTLWASRIWEKPPHVQTLRRYVKEGKISPPPILIGREYQVQANAGFIANSKTIIYGSETKNPLAS